MGSGTSRGKRVAPASVGEASVSGTAAPKRDDRPSKPGAPPDSDLSGEEDVDVDVDPETTPADAVEEQRVAAVAKGQPKRAAVRSRTYGLCHFSQEEEDDEDDASPRETRGSNCGPRVVNRRSNGAFRHASASSSRHSSSFSSSSRGFLTRGSAMEAVPTADKQQTFGKRPNPSVTMPVILYDGSEEELMDTIEREFS